LSGIGSPAILSNRVSRTAHAQKLAVGSTLLAVLVLLGGIAPALYSYGQPHDHFALGGLPPAGWEEHEHVNPLAVFLGPIATPPSVAAAIADPSPPPVPSDRKATAGRVVSVSSGLAPLLLTAVGIVVGPVPIDRFVAGSFFAVIAIDECRLVAQSVTGPRPPPPR
jgi:hypothetical protein